MIKFPHNMTVDDNTASEEISFSAEHVRIQERERVIALLDKSLIYDEPVVIERDRLISLIKGESE